MSTAGAASRATEVSPERLAGWVQRFTASHGAITTTAGPDTLVLDAADGARAVLGVPWPPLAGLPAHDDDLAGGVVVPADLTRLLDALAAHAALPRTAAVLLVRRGGYAAGLARDGVLLDHSGGTRLVQGRTAAGGWSQQRYARRRAHQADALVEAAAGTLHRVLSRSTAVPDVLVVGGDRALVDDVLGHPSVAAVAAMPRSPVLDVPDPRHTVLVDVARRARVVRVTVVDPPAAPRR